MTTDNKHTPGPWRFERHQIGKYFGNIIGSYGKGNNGVENIRTITVQLKYGTPEENEANAQFIVTACNSYYDMLEALRELYASHIKLFNTLTKKQQEQLIDYDKFPAVIKTKAAISKAEGGKL